MNTDAKVVTADDMPKGVFFNAGKYEIGFKPFKTFWCIALEKGIFYYHPDTSTQRRVVEPGDWVVIHKCEVEKISTNGERLSEHYPIF